MVAVLPETPDLAPVQHSTCSVRPDPPLARPTLHAEQANLNRLSRRHEDRA